MTPDQLRQLVAGLPEGGTVTLPRAALVDLCDRLDVTPLPVTPATWRERLWTCPPDTRLGVREVAEAMGRPRSWVYRAVSAKRGEHRLPASRLDGELVFEAGAVRAWIERHAGP